MLNAFLSTMPDPKDGPKLTQYLAGRSGGYNVSTLTVNDSQDSLNVFMQLDFEYSAFQICKKLVFLA